MIDRTRVVGDLLFATHGDRCFYLGKSPRDQLRWLEENPGRWRRIEDVPQEDAPSRVPVEAEIDLGAGPAEPNGQTSSHDVRKDGCEQSDVTLVDAPAGDSSPPYQLTSLPIPVQAIIRGTTKAELLPPAKAAMSETKEPKTETIPLGAVGRKRGRRRRRQPENPKLPAEVAKESRMERMRIVLDSLTEVRILSHAATKAGIHRKTPEYWIKRSEAGDARYDVEWQGLELRFHEQCALAIAEAEDKVVATAWEFTMGRYIYKTDKNGNRVELGFRGPYRKKHGKMLRFLMEWLRSDEWGKNRKIEMPPHCGVLVVGDVPNDIPRKVNKGTAASVRARKWKAAWRMIHEPED